MAFWWMCYLHADWLNVTVMKIHSVIQAWDASQRTHEYSRGWQRTCGQGHMGCTVPHRGICWWTVLHSKCRSHWWVSAQLDPPQVGEFPSVCSSEGAWFQPVLSPNKWQYRTQGMKCCWGSPAQLQPLQPIPQVPICLQPPEFCLCLSCLTGKSHVCWNPLPSWIRAIMGLLLKWGLLTLHWYKAYESNKTCFAIEMEREALMLSMSEFRWLQCISLSYKYSETQTWENSDVKL